MDEIADQALTNMSGLLTSLFPPAVPGIDLSLLLLPQKIKPTGLGGYVGINPTPNASLFGRYIEATSEITIRSANGVPDLQLAVLALTQRLTTQDRFTLRSHGIFSVKFDRLSDISRTGQGNNVRDSRTAIFNLRFEYIPTPVQPEGLIDTLAVNSELALATGQADFFELNFSAINAAGDDPLVFFDFLDDPGIDASSPNGNWQFHAASGQIRQLNDVRGGAAIASENKAGAQALLQRSGQPVEARNFILNAQMESGENDGIGFVFRWIDDNNFYFYVMSARHNYHLMGKKVQGSYAFLDTDGLNESIGYVQDAAMHVKLIAENQRFQIYVDDHFIVSGEDTSLTDKGRMGFLTHGNELARFYSIGLIDFSN